MRHTTIALLIAAALGLTACGQKAAEAPTTATASEPSPALSAYQAQMAKDQQEHPTLTIGSSAPDFKLLGTDDKYHQLSDYRGSKVLAIVFISNHCPASQLYEGRIKALVRDYAAKGVSLVAIAPNGPDVVNPGALNYTDVDDSFEAMKIRASHRQFTFAYLYDGDTQSVSHAYGPKVTPHIYLFDAERKLRYEGRIDNHMTEAKATQHDARNALDALLAGKSVPVDHTPVFGCSTKWKSHAETSQQEMKEWRARPINLESVTLEGLKQLRSNADGKYLMVNFWATWCAPCKTEYPMLLETYLWYRSRGLEFVSVSVDEPGQRLAALKFLQETHSAIRNLQVDTDDVYAVMGAFDKSWESGVPFTMVIAPDGRVIYQRAGEVNKLQLRRSLFGQLPDAGLFAGNAAYWRS